MKFQAGAAHPNWKGGLPKLSQPESELFFLSLPEGERERFWHRVNLTHGPDDCWAWMGTLDDDGYGGFAFGHGCRQLRAHRVAFMLVYGEIPAGMHVCHACDNRKCCNPKHLWLGTNAENVQDCVNKGRMRGPRTSLRPSGTKTSTHCREGHELTPENTYISPVGTHECQTCKKERMRLWRERKRSEQGAA